ncbi:MAG: tetratricopeptide repeat protein [Pseudomonadota bacterium]
MTASLDIDELFHLAIHASGEGRYDSAITFLKQALDQEPENAEMIYLLAAQHAQLGMYDRAIAGMTRSLELKPDLHTNRFQLGLLHLTLGQVDSAVSTWEALDNLEDQESLKLFKQGLCALIQEELDTAHAKLDQGIQNNQANPALNKDMQKIITEIKKMRNNSDEALTGENATENTMDDQQVLKQPNNENTLKTSIPNPVLLSAYRRDSDNANDDD